MDRKALSRFLNGGHETLRWNKGGRDGYEAVETDDEGLRWYRWSHELGAGHPLDEARQSYAAFLADGPLRPAPPAVVAKLRQLIARRDPRPEPEV